MTKERKIYLLMKDGCTKSEAEKFLRIGSEVFEDLEERFDDYMNEWGLDDEEIARFRNMIETKNPVEDWGVVVENGCYFYIMYVL